MKRKLSHTEKYVKSISEYSSTKDIQELLEVSVVKAREIKKGVLQLCASKKIKLYSSYKVPTDLLLEYTGKSTQYYFDKMIAEREVLKNVSA